MLDKIEQKLQTRTAPIGIVGLGYVGLPLACLFAEKYKVVGFDVNRRRISELRDGVDRTREIENKERLLNKNLTYTADPSELSQCPVIIVAVPTPIDNFKKPDLGLVEAASKTVGKVLKPGTIVVFESTVYPGVTEKLCGSILTKESGLKLNVDFWLGYSPERVNPGDKEHTIDKIMKVVSGSTLEAARVLSSVYGSVITAGIHTAPSIATAEAAKVIENTQRDLNIALVNELAMLFDRIGLDTLDVLQAANTKWNFLPFRPGLVGGHCIGVDPYYLTHLAESVNFHPQAILSGRRINDSMSEFIANKAMGLILNSGQDIKGKVKIGILGATFKENIPDIRNTKVLGIAETLEQYGVQVFIFDPVADKEEFEHEYGRKLFSWDEIPVCDALILTVQHDIFRQEFGLPRLLTKLNGKKIILDVKSVLPRAEAQKLGMKIWRL